MRLGKRTKDLVKKLHAGEIAVIDHSDLDRIAAEDLAASGIAAVLNNSPSSTGHYPNVGPMLLARAGVPLIDVAGADLFEVLGSDPIEVGVVDDRDLARMQLLDEVLRSLAEAHTTPDRTVGGSAGRLGGFPATDPETP